MTERVAVSSSPTAMSFAIAGGDVLTDTGFECTSVVVSDGVVARIGVSEPANRTLDATGLLVLPGAIDCHGDAFERLITPRPSVAFDPRIALLEADRQFTANGITTAYHALTWSWEGGDRGEAPARAVLAALDTLAPFLVTDTRLHLRHETFNLAAEATIVAWLEAGRIDCLAFNDHMAGTIKQRHRPDKMRKMVERSGLTEHGFQALVDTVHARHADVPASIARLAVAAGKLGVPMLSHDDMSPTMRDWYRNLGVRIAEFPIDETTARSAAEAGDPIVFGAPNVVRGGSHTGCPSAAEMARFGLCTVLASDYYYPALAHAPFLLDAQDILPLADGWRLVSQGPATALGLTDRGEIAAGKRADLVLAARRSGLPPRIVATIVAGRVVHLAEADRWQS